MGFGGYEVTKAGPAGANAALARNGNDVTRSMQRYLQEAYRRRNALNLFESHPLGRNPQWDASMFGPSMPLVAEPLDPTHNRNGQPDPRLWEYPVAWNVTLGGERHVPWEILKRSADSPVFRACIELRKTELSSMDWGIRVNPKIASRRAALGGDKSAEQVASEMRDKHQDEIDRLETFWQWPDRKNGRNFAEWIGLAADEQLTHDALAIYPHMTYGGDCLGLWIVDGSTIMPILDETGGRPDRDLVAYQQILYGFPRGEFTAQGFLGPDGVLQVPGGYKQGELVYKRRTPRTTTPYGYSATEQALLDGALYNRRFNWMLSEYTEGTLPAAWGESDGQLDWTADQLLDFERDFNMRQQGKTSERFHTQFLPPGFTVKEGQSFGEKYKADYDQYLIKLVAMHFSVTSSELGFQDNGGLGSSGYHEGMEDINFRRGRLPDLRWFADLCTEISISYLGMDPDLEFYFLGLESEDEAAADALMSQRVQDGRLTLNEARASLGYRAYHFAEADKAMLQTNRGVVFLDGASKLVPGGVLLEPTNEVNQISGPNSNNQVTPQGKLVAGNSPAQGTPKTPAQKAELAAYRKFLSKGERRRPFNFEHLTEDEAKELLKAAGADPKVPTRNWSLYTEDSLQTHLAA